MSRTETTVLVVFFFSLRTFTSLSSRFCFGRTNDDDDSSDGVCDDDDDDERFF